MKTANEFIEVIEDRMPVRVRLQDILFAEVYGAKCIIHSSLRNVTTYLSFDALLELMDTESFLRCHRSYLVNLNHVKAIRKGEFILDNGALVLISRRKQNDAQQAFDEMQKKRVQEETQTLSKTPAVFNNRVLTAMKTELGKLENEYWDLRVVAYKNPGNEKIKAELLRISSAVNEVTKAIGDLQNDIVTANTTFNEKAASGKVTSRLNQARKLFDTGNVEATIQLLDLEEMAAEDKQFAALLDEHQKKMISKVSEYIYLADILKTDRNNPGRFNKIGKSYRQAISLENKHSLPERSGALKYSEFLFEQNEFKNALKYAKQHLKWLESGSRLSSLLYKEEQSFIYAIIAKCYMYLSEFEASEQMHKKNLEILKVLQNENSRKYEPLLVTTYNNLAEVYFDVHRYDEAEKLLDTSLKISKRLAEEDPEAYELNLIQSYCNLGYLYTLLQRYDIGEDLLKSGINVYSQSEFTANPLLKCNLGITYNNLAYLYDQSKRFNDAAEMYDKSIFIHKQLADENPAAYEQDLARTYNNLAKVYYNMKNYKDSDELYNMCISIYERLADEDNLVFDGGLSAAYSNYADLLKKTGLLDNAEEVGLKALAIRKDMVAKNPGSYDYDLAISLNSMAQIYKEMKRFDEAIDAQDKAVEIIERLASEDPSFFQLKLETYLTNQKDLYKELKRK